MKHERNTRIFALYPLLTRINARIFKKAAAVFLIVLNSGFAYAKTYSDVPADHLNTKAIGALSDQGILQGYSDGGFSPAGPINRAEVAKVLIAATQTPSSVSQALAEHKRLNHIYATFPDVSMDAWFAPFVETAYRLKIVQGNPDGYFHPERTINLAEALKMVTLAFDADIDQVSFAPNTLWLVNGSEWFAPYFAYAAEKNLLSPHKVYHPAHQVTRGEFAELVYRMKIVAQNTFSPYKAPGIGTSNEYSITIPALNIIDMQVAFADPYDGDAALHLLRYFPFGHYLANPGSGKKFVLFGHSSGYSWDKSPYKVVLRQIDRLKAGDKIYINYRERGYVYEMRESVVIPASKDTMVMQDNGKDELALFTCWPPDSIAYRYVIYAERRT